jgi:REP element-mobilizing transposase RayT
MGLLLWSKPPACNVDKAGQRATWLAVPKIARIVQEALYFSTEKLCRFDLHAWVVMSNHVHMLVSPRSQPSVFMKALKGYTATEANRALNRTGEHFWQHESYDHWVRNEAEMPKIVRYHEWNPAQAGLVEQPEDFPWSSATRSIRMSTLQAGGLLHTRIPG